MSFTESTFNLQETRNWSHLKCQSRFLGYHSILLECRLCTCELLAQIFTQTNALETTSDFTSILFLISPPHENEGESIERLVWGHLSRLSSYPLSQTGRGKRGDTIPLQFNHNNVKKSRMESKTFLGPASLEIGILRGSSSATKMGTQINNL